MYRLKSRNGVDMRRLVMLSIVLALAVPLSAQEAGPSGSTAMAAASPEDVNSLDAIIAALYDVISGPAGARDWARFGSLFRDGARLIPTGVDSTGKKVTFVWTPEQYAERAGRWFVQNAFYEREANRVVEQYGQIAHVFSTYESRRDQDTEPFARGINSIQLFHDGSRWWIISIFWGDERSAGPIPARYLPGM